MDDVAMARMPDTVEEGYAAVKNLIFDQVHKFRRRYGGDPDDLVGEANVAFVKGHAALAAKATPAEAYPMEIRRWVWYSLFDAMRVRLERKRKVQFSSTTDQEDVYAEQPKAVFDREEFVGGLTEDGRVAAELVLSPPEAVERVAMAKGGTPRNYKSTVRTYLRTESGWSTDRVNAAFEEIMGALGK